MVLTSLIILSVSAATTATPQAPAPAQPVAPKQPATAAQSTLTNPFTPFPCFENRTNLNIAGYGRDAQGKVHIVPVRPGSGACLTELRPDPAKPGMTVGTALLDRKTAEAKDLEGREVTCFMSLQAMKAVGFRVAVSETDDGLYCESVR